MAVRIDFKCVESESDELHRAKDQPNPTAGLSVQPAENITGWWLGPQRWPEVHSFHPHQGRKDRSAGALWHLSIPRCVPPAFATCLEPAWLAWQCSAAAGSSKAKAHTHDEPFFTLASDLKRLRHASSVLASHHGSFPPLPFLAPVLHHGSG
jgi:hypothetical protein